MKKIIISIFILLLALPVHGRADTLTTDLPAVTSAASTDTMIVDTSSATSKITVGNLLTSLFPYTFPATVPTVGKVLISDGTNLIGSTALGTAAYAATGDFDAAGTAAGVIAASISDADTTHAPDGNSVFDALALKAPSTNIALTALADQAAYTLVGNATADAAAPTAVASSANIFTLLGSATNAAALTNLGGWGISGSITDEQLICAETTGGTNLLKSCGAKTTNNSTATNILANDNSTPPEVENLTLPGGFAMTGTTSPTLTMTDRLVATFDGGGSEIADNKKVYIYVPWACTIASWTILADQAGAINFGVWKQAYADHPPEVANTITDGHDPDIAASADQAQDLDVADWSGEALSAGDVLAVNVDSCTTITWASITFLVTR